MFRRYKNISDTRPIIDASSRYDTNLLDVLLRKAGGGWACRGLYMNRYPMISIIGRQGSRQPSSNLRRDAEIQWISHCKAHRQKDRHLENTDFQKRNLVTKYSLTLPNLLGASLSFIKFPPSRCYIGWARGRRMGKKTERKEITNIGEIRNIS
ncbi:hypothetical protein I7I53_00845 [Histoplasma capsulatum var. duboisii H88]|uniref:Uncharacterized protein n=1 Tax=Ajellomyces capsulatus (strain H88) TaxID=544711 RepID=A0A8A1LI51_AJEC8|nr:hypothetical protein I7I53_00845 [Histoplasma capsulatum var. duboisii H88]